MSTREQIRLELVKALLAQGAVQAITQYVLPPTPSTSPYPGMLERVDVLEKIVMGGPQAHVTEAVVFPPSASRTTLTAPSAVRECPTGPTSEGVPSYRSVVEATMRDVGRPFADPNPVPTGWIPGDLSVAVYRKKPINIAARQFVNNNDSNADLDGLVAWIACNGGRARHDGTSIYIRTPEGEMRADIKDWIIRGVKGEFYPCKPDVFEASYEPVVPPRDPQRTSTTEKVPG